jgi:hypothetical protein
MSENQPEVSAEYEAARPTTPDPVPNCFDPLKSNYDPDLRYNLRGPQVQPDASYWHDCGCSNLCVARPEEGKIASYIDNLPDYPTGNALRAEIRTLYRLAELRDQPYERSAEVFGRPYGVSPILQYRPAALGLEYSRLRPELSPAERVQAEKNPSPSPVARTGREVSRLFECEIPGVALRHALEALLLQTGGPPPYFVWSPPMQSLVYAALDVTIYSAQLAAWYAKYRVDPARLVSFRPRPVEVDPGLPVLYDREVNEEQNGDGTPRILPSPHPGTPRHPAYPSGHSVTYAAAAEVMAAFFPDRKYELDALADNANKARVIAAVHTESDVHWGAQLGRVVGREILAQLRRSCICPPDPCNPAGACDPPTTREAIDLGLANYEECCDARKEEEAEEAEDESEDESE